jgi:hypothetical protein
MRMSAGLGTRAAGTGEVCPICRWPDQGSAVCGRCGWELIGGYVLGPATAADWLNLAARLADRQRNYDLRAAARAAGVAESRDQALLARLAGLARGGPPRPEQIEEAIAQVDGEDPPPGISSAGTVFALTRLVAGKTDAIAFVEIGPDAVSVETLVVDALGVPARLVGDSLPWIAILPLLPSDTDLRYLRMAGGVGRGRSGRDADMKPEDADPAALIAAVDDAIKPVLARLTAAASAAAAIGRVDRASDDPGSSPHSAPHRLDTVLVQRTHRWPLLDAAVARGSAVMRPVAEIVAAPDSGTLAEVVESVAARAPLRYGYDLVLVEVDRRTGAVRPRPHELFPAGVAVLPGAPPVKTVEISPVPGHAAKQLALPIVARRGPVANFRDLLALKEQRPLITMAALDGTIEGPVQLRVRLTKPGLLRALAAPELFPPDAESAGWPALIGELPEWLLSAALSSAPLASAGSLDLVLLVELGGVGEDAVAARVRLASGVVRAFRDAPAVRIAVMGYRDHFGKHRADAIAMRGKEKEALVVGCGLSTAAGAQSMFQRPERWQAVPVGDDHAAPIEDALLIVGRLRGWRPDARHVLVVLGRRPPHPAKAGRFGDVMLPCPHRCSWQDALGRLRHEQAVECFAVLDRRPEPGYAEQAWRQFGAQGHFWSGSTTAQVVARTIGLARQPGTRLRLATLVDAASPPSYGEDARL